MGEPHEIGWGYWELRLKAGSRVDSTGSGAHGRRVKGEKFVFIDFQ